MSKFSREIEVRGHLIDSLILTKIFDGVMDLGGEFEVKKIQIGKKKKDEPTGPVPFLVFDDELIKLTVGDFTDALHPPYKCKVKN